MMAPVLRAAIPRNVVLPWGYLRAPHYPLKSKPSRFGCIRRPLSPSTLLATSFRRTADVVIIGSGLSGASFARTLLDLDDEGEDDAKPLKVVMLEAQDTCSGATGRNGGHINPALYHDYELLKREFGKTTAQQIIRFRLAHFDVLSEVAAEEAKDADCREVQTVDVFFDELVFAEAKRKLAVYKADMPQEATPYCVWEGDEARVVRGLGYDRVHALTGVIARGFNLSSLAIGCITTRAGAVHPYRFVTDILSRLLEAYPKYFQLFTETPCIFHYRTIAQESVLYPGNASWPIDRVSRRPSYKCVRR
ncbi:hypothetical protein JVU11DRAFT_9500 [Chiua virens]|nr:hypothetical protein JVU11DRAFT_9500 [Chiua virens]